MSRWNARSWMLLMCLLAHGMLTAAMAQDARDDQRADVILHGGKIVTVDERFSIHEAIAVRGDRILAVGSNDQLLQLRGPDTEILDLQGKLVLPGLMDSHVHPGGASVIEFAHPIPDMQSIDDVLAYIAARTQAVRAGQWITVRQVFITRLREQRFPTRQELDRVAPHHPVLFATGPDAALNSLALQLSKIDKDFTVTDGGPGYIEKDPQTGEPTGILRACTRYVAVQPSAEQPTEEQRAKRLEQLLRDYNSVGITAIGDRNADPQVIGLYRSMRQEDRLTIRVAISHAVQSTGDIEKIQDEIQNIARHPLRSGDAMLRIIGIKMFLDGGMLTGSAYMREPWGVSKIYSINDPQYQGLLFIPPERLLPLVRTTVESGLQFTAHAVGDGAVHALLDAYEEVDRTAPVRTTRPCITHSNFMSQQAVERCAALGVLVDIQPAWLYLDARTLVQQFGYDRLRYFQPLRSLFDVGAIAGGGSDHMQKIGSLRSINPYNPFLGMQTAITRRARWYDKPLHPEQAITRQEAIRLYTANNAYLLGLDECGSLEPGKLADLIVLDTDVLTCPAESLVETKCLRTYVGGKLVFERK